MNRRGFLKSILAAGTLSILPGAGRTWKKTGSIYTSVGVFEQLRQCADDPIQKPLMNIHEFLVLNYKLCEERKRSGRDLGKIVFMVKDNPDPQAKVLFQFEGPVDLS